jgi:hypothetical protein
VSSSRTSRRLLSGGCGWFSGWRRADSRVSCRLGLTHKASVARRRPRTFGVT